MKHRSPGNGTKVGSTAIIWTFATGMLAICIPLVTVTKSGVILPLAVILGTSVSTVAVWRSGDRSKEKIEKLIDRVRVLEQRTIDLETICSSEELDIANKIKQLEQKN
jgi:hypothetical protein